MTLHHIQVRHALSRSGCVKVLALPIVLALVLVGIAYPSIALAAEGGRPIISPLVPPPF